MSSSELATVRKVKAFETLLKDAFPCIEKAWMQLGDLNRYLPEEMVLSVVCEDDKIAASDGGLAVSIDSFETIRVGFGRQCVAVRVSERADAKADETTMNRRTFLYGIGATSATIPLAGCGEAETEPTGGADDDTEPAGDDNGTGDGSPTDDVSVDDGDDTDDSVESEYVDRPWDEDHDQVMLKYGETARVSNGVEFTVHGVEVREQVGEQTPDERDAWVLVALEAENTSEAEQSLPMYGLDIIFGNQQTGPTFNYGAMREEGLPEFDGGDVQGGVHREGIMLFEVDEGFGPEDIDVLWQDNFMVAPEDNDIDVRWTTSV